jgi:hypothetical protein
MPETRWLSTVNRSYLICATTIEAICGVTGLQKLGVARQGFVWKVTGVWEAGNIPLPGLMIVLAGAGAAYTALGGDER